jgi:hypothetical protein
MADIDVVPKHHSHAWVWIVLAIAVIAVLFWAFAARTRAVAHLPSAPEETVAVAVSIEAMPASA